MGSVLGTKNIQKTTIWDMQNLVYGRNIYLYYIYIYREIKDPFLYYCMHVK